MSRDALSRTAGRYSLSIGVILLAVLLRWLTDPIFGATEPYLIVFPTVIILALFSGIGPAVVASIIGGMATEFTFVDPTEPALVTHGDLARMLVVVFSAAFVGRLSQRLRAAQAQALDQASGRVKAEAESQRNREQMRIAAEAAGIGVWEYDLLADQPSWDAKHCELFGIPLASKPSLETFIAAIHPDDRDRVLEAAHHTLREGVDLAEEYRVLHPDGSVRWILDRGRVQRDGNGNPVRVTGVVVDITTTKAAEDELRASRERLEWILGTTGVGLWLNRLPLDKLVWDKRTRELFFIPPGVEPTIDLFWSRVHPDDREPTRLAVEAALRDGSLYEIDHRAVNPETGEIRWVRSAGQARYDEDGTPIRFDGINYDVTQRKQAESILRSSAQRFELLARSAEQLLQSREPQKVVESLCRAVMEHLDCHAFFNFLVDPSAGKLRLNACAGIPADEAKRIEWLEYGAAVCGCAARDGCRIIAEHIPDRPDPRTDLVSSYGIRAYACHPLLGPGGEVLGTLSFGTRSRDTFSADDLSLMKAVTDQVAVAMTRMRGETALRESEERFRTMADGLPLIVWVHGPDGNQQFVNQTFCEFFGVTEAEMRGGRWKAFVHPDDAAHYSNEFMACVAEQKPFHAEARVQVADGQWRWVESWARPRLSSSGECLGFVGASADVTKRKEAEAALRESEERVRLAVAAGRMGTWDWDVVTGHVEWSEGTNAILGYKPNEVEPTYEAFRSRVHPDDMPVREREFHDAVENRREYVCEYRIIWSDGSIHWIEARGNFVYDEAGKPVRMYGVAIDVDQRKQLEQQRFALLEAERAARMESEKLVRLKDEFLATVSHELRSPLSAIAGWTGLLAKGKTDPDKALGIIQRSTSSLAQIVEDLLDMSRIISGKIRLSPDVVNLSELVNNAVDGVQFTALAKHIDIQVTFAPDLAPIECDPNRVQQIIWNLLTNAIKFTPDGGHVELAVTQTLRNVSILVKDNGKGIAPQFLPYLFDRFRQEDGGIARKHGGLGLGLSIVKHLVELHGGTIEAHSDGEGRGALFIVTLPRVGATNQPDFLRPSFTQSPQPAPVQLDECTLSGIKVLAVDDDPFSRELLGRTLSDTGAVVRTVDSVQHALAALNEFRPDVLISDIGMPEEDGYSFIRKLKTLTNDWRNSLPAIAVTAFSRPEDRERAILAGFDEHMSKPFDPATLCVTIRKLVPHKCSVAAACDTLDDKNDLSEKAVTAPRSVVEPPPPPRRRHILLAEDNLVISEMIKAALEEHGYEVSVADTISLGVEIANRRPIDILLSDLRLKDGHGWDLLTRLHSVRQMPAIVMSGYADTAYIKKSKAAGFTEYLVKPVDPDELLKVIGSLLNGGV